MKSTSARFYCKMQIMLFIGFVKIVVTIALPAMTTEAPSENEVSSYDFPFVTRSQWQARYAKDSTPLNTPVPYVVIHHSYIPAACYNFAECSKAMRSMQNFHMDDRKWWDIGYNFAVGSDGAAYEGRGWLTLGAHALHFNSVSLGICLIGDWSSSLPPSEQLQTAKAIIAAGVEMGYIKPNYKLVGHRQVRDTACPGDALYQYIQQIPHWTPHPSSVKELIHVEELPAEIKELLKSNSTSVS